MGKIDWLELDHSISFKRVALRRQTLHRWGHRIVKFNANKPSAGDQPISLVNFFFFFFAGHRIGKRNFPYEVTPWTNEGWYLYYVALTGDAKYRLGWVAQTPKLTRQLWALWSHRAVMGWRTTSVCTRLVTEETGHLAFYTQSSHVGDDGKPHYNGWINF